MTRPLLKSPCPQGTARRAWRLAAALCLAAALAGCASPRGKAPVETRPTSAARPAAAAPVRAVPVPSPTAVVASPAAPASAAPPGADNAGKPGFHTVRPGDTLIRIGLDNGQNWRDIARWNNLDNPNLIEVGQVLRVAPPGVDASAAASRPVAAAGRVESRPLSAGGGAAAPTAAGGATAAPSPAASPAASAPSPPPAPAREEEEVTWAWPAAGSVLAGFEEGRSKGLAIGGKAGDPVLAAADGRVVYAGSGLRGYGNLVIVKHNATFLSAYAHNQALLVKEDQLVRRGQRIAEMGSSDAERVQLHFEIRRQGRPVDPARMLPPR